ncbi:short transient receptor potential channel 4-like, partial [Diadema antillarum]|uniref:short transient receptor potential channel 4-like n=1 Tax=Diadema antillarum TaxID=105358 RepID=UPI003A85A899
LQTLHRTSRNEQTEDPVAKIRQGVSADQKPFVTHPFTQNALSQDYYAELDGMKRPTLWLLTLMALVCYPVFSLLYLIYPAGVVHRFLKIPHISVFMHLGSDLTLMAFVIFLSVEDRSSPFVSFWCQMVTFIICLGISGRHVRMIYRKGPEKFLSFPMSLMDSLLVKTCFTTLYTIWISLLIDNYTHMTIQRYEASLIVPATNATSSSNVDYNQGTANSTPTTLPTTQFGPEWVTAQWDDPRVVSNALYSLVVTICTIRTFYILTTNSLPIYVIAKAVVDMVVDVVRISFMYIYIVLAFGLGITFVYRSVWEMTAFDCKVKGIPVSECPRSTFSYSVDRSIVQLFWTIFGLVSIPQLSLDLQPDDHYMSYVFAFLFVGYMIISVVVLLNLLIAVMSSRYADVESNADKEWKFSRSQVWLSYISQEDEVTLPPPFNLLPSTKQIHDFFKWCCSEKKKEPKPKKKLVRLWISYATVVTIMEKNSPYAKKPKLINDHADTAVPPRESPGAAGDVLARDPSARRELLSATDKPCYVAVTAAGLSSSQPPQWFVQFFSEFENRLDVRIESLLDKKCGDLTSIVTEHDEKIKSLSFDIANLRDTVQALQTDNGKLERKLDDLENRSRRNNLVVFGIQESNNKEDCKKLIQDFLRFADVPEEDINDIQRCHRTPSFRPQGQENAPHHPRRIHIGFGSFTAKERARKACINKLKAL